MFINARIALAVLAFTGVSIAAPTPERTIKSGDGALVIPDGAKDIRVHQSYNKHHHHGSNDLYDEKVHYRLPDAKRSPRSDKKKHPKVLAAGDDETPAPSSGTHHGKHHRDEREAAKGDDASSIKKPNGHKHKTATKEKAEKEKPAEPVEKRRDHVTVIQTSEDGHSHGHSHSHSHDHSHSHKRQEEDDYEPEAAEPESEPVEEPASSGPPVSSEKKPNKVNANAGKVVKTGVLQGRRHSRDKTIIIEKEDEGHDHSHSHVHRHSHSHKRELELESRRYHGTVVIDKEDRGHDHSHSHVHSHSHSHKRSHHDTVIIEKEDKGHDHSHSHSHVHSHSHKRALLSRSGRPIKAKRDWMSEGTAGYIDVTSPLFGSDEGQRIASLVLSSGTNSTASSNSSFVLNASNSTRTQVYLVPSNSSNFVHDTADTSLIEVSLKVPVFNPSTAATVPYCASFDPNPPSPCPLSVQKCGAEDSEHLSQRFVYSPATGVIRPLWAVGANESLSTGNSSKAESRKRDYLVEAAKVQANAVNATQPLNSPSSSILPSLTSASSSALPSSSSIAFPSSTLVAEAAAASPTSTSSPSNVQPAQSVSLVFTPVNPSAVLAVGGNASLGFSNGKDAAPSEGSDVDNGEEDETDGEDYDAEAVPSSTAAAPESSATSSDAVSSSTSSSSLPPLATPTDAF